LFLAFLVAYTLNPIVDRFQAWGVRRGFSIAALTVLGALVLLSIPLLLVPSLIAQADQLVSSATAAGGTEGEPLQGRVWSWFDRVVTKLALEDRARALGWISSEEGELDVRAELAERIGLFVKTHAAEFLNNFGVQIVSLGQKAGATLTHLFASVGRGVAALLVFLGSASVFAFVAGYLLKDFHALVAGAKGLVPPLYRDKVCELAGKIDSQLRGFLRGQLLVCTCLGLMYATGLLLSCVPFAIPIALFGMMAFFIPYIGPLLTLCLALLLALVQHGFDWHGLGAIATFVVAQSVEGTILTPKIVGSQVGLHPVWVIVGLLVFGHLLGFIGLLLAVPLTASLKVLVLEALTYYKRSSLFAAGGAGGGS
jgi:predicted PurR-regulated permease PerM